MQLDEPYENQNASEGRLCKNIDVIKTFQGQTSLPTLHDNSFARYRAASAKISAQLEVEFKRLPLASSYLGMYTIEWHYIKHQLAPFWRTLGVSNIRAVRLCSL
jgi:hypothetical protein